MTELPSTEVFARNAVDFDGFGYTLIDVARAELGGSASGDELDDRAGGLLLEALLRVGLNPRTELTQRNRLARLLQGERLSDGEIQKAVEYVLSQMVIQPKGALAECLAIRPCANHLLWLKQSGKLPSSAELIRGIWAKRILGLEDGQLLFGEWREAADFLFCAHPNNDLRCVVEELSSSRARPKPGDLLVLGTAEVKCYSRVSRKRLRKQQDSHLLRLAGGLQIRSSLNREVRASFSADQIWFATPDENALHVVCAADHPLTLGESTGSTGREIALRDPNLAALIRFSVGPHPRAGGRTRRGGGAFDAFLPYDEDELETMGVAMADYTLGAMADQPDIDLSGDEWSHNLARALQSIDGALTRRQKSRREKLLRRLR